MITTETHRLHTTVSPEVRRRIAGPIQWLEQDLTERDTDWDTRIQHRPVWREKDHWLSSVPGVGRV